jgi:flagellar basal body-associated protein FliL
LSGTRVTQSSEKKEKTKKIKKVFLCLALFCLCVVLYFSIFFVVNRENIQGWQKKLAIFFKAIKR